uniref:Interferon-induced guanylate-binding protein n=1 Tax=Solanum tuberosum TaxID=4113 RepID=M1B7M5_SOLTU
MNETTLDSKLRTASHGKCARIEEYEAGVESALHMGKNDRVTGGNKRSKSTTSPIAVTCPEDEGSEFRGDNVTSSQQTNTEDYTKYTVQKVKQELIKHNFGAELLLLKNPNKKDILALYEKCVLQLCFLESSSIGNGEMKKNVHRRWRDEEDELTSSIDRKWRG